MFQVFWDVMFVDEVTVSNSMEGRIASIFRDKPNPDKAPHPKRLESSATLL
jgi:hypothetical protein